MKIHRINFSSWVILDKKQKRILHPTPQQSRMLDALTRAWPYVCQKADLMTALVSRVEYQQVAAHIAGLRKIGFDILNVPGHGYKIIADQLLL